MIEGLIAGTLCALAVLGTAALAVLAVVVGGLWAIPLVLLMLPLALFAMVTWKMYLGFAHNTTDADGRRW